MFPHFFFPTSTGWAFKSLKELFSISGHTSKFIQTEGWHIMLMNSFETLPLPSRFRCVYKWERRWECRGLIASAILIPRSANWLRHFRTWGGYAVRYTAASIYVHVPTPMPQAAICARSQLLFFFQLSEASWYCHTPDTTCKYWGQSSSEQQRKSLLRS